jgi:sarcosine dehydrogenase
MSRPTGRLACEKVVNCAGQWARQVGAMAGINVPLQPVKHQYIITEPVEGLSTMPHHPRPGPAHVFQGRGRRAVLGRLRADPIAWTTGDVPDDFQFQLFDDDWDHFEQHMSQAIARVPALADTASSR